MSFLTHVLQGSYAYFLAVQLLVVAGLFYAFLCVVGRKLRRAPAPEASAEVAALPPGENELARLAEVVRVLDEENGRMKALVDENRILRDKVKYLEQKLVDQTSLEKALVASEREGDRLRHELARAEQTQGLPPVAGASDPVLSPVDPKLLTLLS